MNTNDGLSDFFRTNNILNDEFNAMKQTYEFRYAFEIKKDKHFMILYLDNNGIISVEDKRKCFVCSKKLGFIELLERNPDWCKKEENLFTYIRLWKSNFTEILCCFCYDRTVKMISKIKNLSEKGAGRNSLIECIDKMINDCINELTARLIGIDKDILERLPEAIDVFKMKMHKLLDGVIIDE